MVLRFRGTVYLVLTVLSFTSYTYGQGANGIIKGKVISRNSKEPLIAITVLLQGTKTGAVTDQEGNYLIKNIAPGSYNLEFRSIGFDSYIRTDVLVKPGRITSIETELKESVIQTETVTISSGYFRDIDANSPGAVSFNDEEIRRSPGAMGDVSRILMALPSTAKVSDDNNDLIVRGGSPAENGFFIDGVSVPNINHFPNAGSTGGPIGILNVNFINDFSFLTSGFSSAYGDRLSSVIDIHLREGNKDQYNFQADLNWAGFGGGAEGPLTNDGSWMLSFKRSYLDLISKASGWGMIIRYGDAQAKVNYDLNKSHKLSLLSIYADDHEEFGREDALEQGGDYYGLINNYQNTTGLSWRALWSTGFYSITNFSVSLQSFKNDFYKVSSLEKSNVSDNLEAGISFRNTNYLQLDKFNKLEFGLDINKENGNYDYVRYPEVNRLGLTDPMFIVKRNISPIRLGVFGTYIFDPVERLNVSLGIRGDYYSLNKKLLFSPRISASYNLTDRLKLKANGGMFFQKLPLLLLAQKPEFSTLDNIIAAHYGAGFEYLVSEDTKLSLEVYAKEYDQMPVSETDPALSVIDGGLTGNAFGNYESLLSKGKGYTRGAELLVQKKMSDDVYGIISGSYFRSRYKDYNGEWHDRIYDNKFIFSFIGGYKPSGDWELSLRWTYAGGCPYTPFDFEKSKAENTGIIDYSAINGARYPDYHSLNLRIDKKFFFNTQSLDVYISVWNAYNRKNISEYYWNTDKKQAETIYQWGLLPIFGIQYDL